MATSKIRVQTFLDSSTYKALQTFSQENELSLSSAVEKIVILHFGGEQRSEYKNEQPLKEIENRLTLLEQQFLAWRDGESNSEYENGIKNHWVGEQLSEQESEYIICYLVDGNITGYWGKRTDEVKCDWMTEMSQANTYDKELIAKREATKLKKKFRNWDIRYNTTKAIAKLLGQDVAEAH